MSRSIAQSGEPCARDRGAPERRAAAQRTKRASLRGKPRDRRFARRAMHALVGNLPVPSLEVRDERTQLGKRRPAIALRFT